MRQQYGQLAALTVLNTCIIFHCELDVMETCDMVAHFLTMLLQTESPNFRHYAYLQHSAFQHKRARTDPTYL